MSGFLEKYNTDDVFLRALIISFVRALNDKITYFQVNDKQEVIEIFIPFFYSLAGDESFLQDQYLNYYDCEGNQVQAEGNYDVIPRGIVILNGVNIDAASITSKHVRTTYTIEDTSGEMKAFSAYTNQIPLTLDFSIRMRADTMLDVFKIFQSTLETFYKILSFNFEYSGSRISAQCGFPEQYNNDKQFEFSYGNSQQWIETSFNVSMETFFPQRDKSTERFRGNLMQAGIKFQTDVGRDLRDNSSLIN